MELAAGYTSLERLPSSEEEDRTSARKTMLEESFFWQALHRAGNAEETNPAGNKPERTYRSSPSSDNSGDISHHIGRQDQLILNTLAEIKKGNWRAAQEITESANSALAARLFNWLWLVKQNNPPPFNQASRFLVSTPAWPYQYAVRRQIERSLDLSSSEEAAPPTAAEIKSWFDARPPLTPAGMRHYLVSLRQLGEFEVGRQTFQEFWATTLMPSADQKYFYRNFSDWLDEQANARRLDLLLRARQYTNARNLAKVMKPTEEIAGKQPGAAHKTPYENLTEARIALAERKAGVGWYIRQVPEAYRNDPGLLYERLKWRRKRNLNDGAREILSNAPEPQKLYNPKLWWQERHIIIRRLIEEGRVKEAYALAATHRQTEGFSYAQAEWVAGWLALRFQDKPLLAYAHFQNLYQNVETPISRARGAYWSGKAQEKLGQVALAAHWYNMAASHGGTFYGQLAINTLKSLQPQLESTPLLASAQERPATDYISYSPEIADPEVPAVLREAFEAHELRNAAYLLRKAGFEEEAEAFVEALARIASSPADFRMVADFSYVLGYPHKALEAAKEASYVGIVIPSHQFPLGPAITYQDIAAQTSIEPALILSIMRQESAFNAQAKSSAGARGLMQIMPATAGALARKHKIRHHTAWLTDKPEHNVLIGSIYLKDLLKRYDNSYVLVTAAYNAGPTRVNQWLRHFGDPRKEEVSWIDWMELIPVYETRNYVQRVLESVYVYRTLFAEIESPFDKAGAPGDNRPASNRTSTSSADRKSARGQRKIPYSYTSQAEHDDLNAGLN